MNEQEQLKNRVTELEKELTTLKGYIMQISDNRTFAMRRNMRIDGDTELARLNTRGDTSIGKNDSKIGFFGTTPVIQQVAITKPTGGATVDTEARTAINKIIDCIQLFGLTQ